MPTGLQTSKYPNCGAGSAGVNAGEEVTQHDGKWYSHLSYLLGVAVVISISFLLHLGCHTPVLLRSIKLFVNIQQSKVS